MASFTMWITTRYTLLNETVLDGPNAQKTPQQLREALLEPPIYSYHNSPESVLQHIAEYVLPYDSLGWNSLHVACYNMRLEKIRFILQECNGGAKAIHALDYSGCTPLALLYSRIATEGLRMDKEYSRQVLELILDSTDIDIHDVTVGNIADGFSDGCSLAAVCVLGDRIDLLQMLVEKYHLNLNAPFHRRDQPNTLFHLALQCHCSVELVKYLNDQAHFLSYTDGDEPKICLETVLYHRPLPLIIYIINFWHVPDWTKVRLYADEKTILLALAMHASVDTVQHFMEHVFSEREKYVLLRYISRHSKCYYSSVYYYLARSHRFKLLEYLLSKHVPREEWRCINSLTYFDPLESNESIATFTRKCKSAFFREFEAEVAEDLPFLRKTWEQFFSLFRRHNESL